MDQDLTLLMAQCHIDLFYTGGPLLIEIWNGEGREETIAAFKELGFEVVSEGPGASFTVDRKK